ncbi:tpd52 like 2b isoform X7 [Gambusia affinis]|uniref:tpd52 like 2b isoform X7 n=1 Tax=Gambusia affinis TaxID=33528 RepID=UPI001CDB9CA8|nr:tpd52 like 2b isoform X7 [Gambusia affinis]
MDPTSQDINLNSPNKGNSMDRSDNMADVQAEGAAAANSALPLPPGLTEEEAEELHLELTKVEEEINTLRQVLSAKERHASELKRKLGLSPLNELKQNITKSWQDVQTSQAYLSASATLDDITHSEAYKKTQETLSEAGQRTSAAFNTLGTAISRRLGDMRALPFSNSFSSNYSIRHSISMPAMRNSPTFKSFEDKVGNLKHKVVAPRGNGDTVSSPTDTTPTQDNPPF